MDTALQRFLAERSPDFEQAIEFGGGAHRLSLAVYLTKDIPPDSLVLSGRALVLRERDVLVVQNPGGEHVLPGGRREAAESPEDSAHREVLEDPRVTNRWAQENFGQYFVYCETQKAAPKNLPFVAQIVERHDYLQEKVSQ